MVNWATADATHHAIRWNRERAKRAERDATRNDLKVPRSATRRVVIDGRTKDVRMTEAEYRASRLADADRHRRNIAGMEEHLA